MPPRRSKDQLIARILEICLQADSSKTRIVYQANLNFNTINSYLELLTRKGFLEASSDKYPTYKTTPNGRRALESLRVIEAIIMD